MSRAPGQPSGGPRSGGHVQDFITRIRYTNQLPPPPNPPKLLDIPNPAVAQYTDTSFASKLVREQPPNIEVDSELGMPLDLVHLPSVFERDDSAVRAMQPPPPVHPADLALLRTADQLGKPQRANLNGASGVSFLRRSEFLVGNSDLTKSTFTSTTSLSLLQKSQSSKRVKLISEKSAKESDPIRILAAVMRGFDVANPETKGLGYQVKPQADDKTIAQAEHNWANPTHPLNPKLKPVEFFPVLPDPEGLGESTGYMVYKFATEPLGSVDGLNRQRDLRADVGMLRIREKPASGASQKQVNQELAQFGLDYYVPVDNAPGHIRTIKRKFADVDGELDTPQEREAGMAPVEGVPFQFIRAYEQHNTREGADLAGEIAFVLYDPALAEPVKKEAVDKDLFGDDDDDAGDKPAENQEPTAEDRLRAGMCGREKEKAMYWYPLLLRSTLRTKRDDNIAEQFFRNRVTDIRSRQTQDPAEEGRYDLLSVRARGLTDEERARAMEGARMFLDNKAVISGGGGTQA